MPEGRSHSAQALDRVQVRTRRETSATSMRERGGIVQDVCFERIHLAGMRSEAIVLNMYYGSSTAESQSDVPPVFRDILIKDVFCEDAGAAVTVRGLLACTSARESGGGMPPLPRPAPCELCHREGHGEAGALAQDRLDGDLAAHGFGQFPDQGQPDSSAGPVGCRNSAGGVSG